MISKLKSIALTSLAGLVAVSAITYSVLFFNTGEFNPIKANKIVNQRESEKIKSRNFNFNKLFGPGGYADANKDGILNIKEQADLHRRLGYKELFIEGKTRFGIENEVNYILSERLERAVKSYEN